MKRAVCALAVLCGFVTAAQADVFYYQINGGIAIRLHGTTTRAPGGATFYRHPKFGRITLDQDRISDYERLDTMQSVQTKRFNDAKQLDDAEEIFAVANECLRRGMLPLFYEGVERVLELDPQHEGALRVKRVKAMLDKPIPDTGPEEDHLVNYVANPRMEIAKSAHYLLLHDTGDKPIHESRRKSRAEERLELLETVYEAFMMRFWAAGVELEVPTERMQVVLFNEHADYLAFSQSSTTAGYYDPKSNIAFFYNQGTHEAYEGLKVLLDFYEEEAAARKRSGLPAGDAIRSAKTFGLLVQVAHEKEDIEVVTHEGTHQLASNTGLLPRDILIPKWVHEGLATYFESPDEASWAGFGSVNESRLRMYSGLAKNDREHSNLDFIVGDEIFSEARGIHSNVLHAYAQAWALTYYLMENHFEEFMEFYRRIGEMPPDLVLSAEQINAVFNDVFDEKKRSGLNRAWHSYMSSLETPEEQLRNMSKR